MEIGIVVDVTLSIWLYLCTWFSIIALGFGIVYLSISFLIWANITLEGKIRTEKVWRQAIKEYIEKSWKT